ncbi:rhodanese-like domain-containing protein [Salininema proteolyticum]|uniref:Rhodanese-like domain-containing protein n=1 Tax=Salininema proteolyticum TaxID=1607685 RepID=A0ABV8TYU5_9ACTN
MSDIHLEVIPDPGLGNASYIVDLGDGGALVVDPSRDLRAHRARLERSGLRPRWTAETHLHADFTSGTREFAHSDGAEILASAAGGRSFRHRGLADGDELDLGGLTLRALGTPGHTDEHLSYLLLDGAKPLGVFTGGSLLVSSAARTDLVDPSRTEELARAQYRSLQRLLDLPDEVAVWPTHGAGSFCSAPASSRRVSTIGTEKAANPLLQASGEDEFVRLLTAGLGSYPAYFDRLPEVNRLGPPLLPGAPTMPALAEDDVRRRLSSGALLIDVRPVGAFARSHVPGAVSIALRDQFASWLGWVVDPDRPVVVVRDADQDPAEILWQAVKIGHNSIVGELADGMSAWTGPTSSIPLYTAAEAVRAMPNAAVWDVRQRSEFAAGHVPRAVSIELGSLAAEAPRSDEVLVMCGHGERAMTAASLAPASSVAVLAGGPADLAAATGTSLVEGS